MRFVKCMGTLGGHRGSFIFSFRTYVRKIDMTFLGNVYITFKTQKSHSKSIFILQTRTKMTPLGSLAEKSNYNIFLKIYLENDGVSNNLILFES